MKPFKLLFSFSLIAILFTSCYTEPVVEEEYIDPVETITLAELVASYELWYVDIERTTGNGNIPFLQKAFTLSFRNGNVSANNRGSRIWLRYRNRIL